MAIVVPGWLLVPLTASAATTSSAQIVNCAAEAYRGVIPADRWHELAVFPADFDAAGAAGVWDQQVDAADDTLGVLLSRSMVLFDRTQQSGRVRMDYTTQVYLGPLDAKRHSA